MGYYSMQAAAPHSPTALAGFFGDNVAKGLNQGLDWVVKKAMPTSSTLSAPRPQTAKRKRVVALGDYASFKSQVTAVFKEETLIVKGMLAELHAKANNDREMPANLIAAVKKQFPSKMKWTPTLLETMGIIQVDAYVDALRGQYAKDWFYFGNNPEPIGMSKAEFLEKQLWALWILDQDYKITFNGGGMKLVQSKDNVPLNFPILDRLVDLHVASPEVIRIRNELQPGFWDLGPVEKLAPNFVGDEADLASIKGWAKSIPRYGKAGFQRRPLGTITAPGSIGLVPR